MHNPITKEDIEYEFYRLQSEGELHHTAKIENFENFINNEENASCFICENTSYGEFYCSSCLEHIESAERFYEEEKLNLERAYGKYRKILKSRKYFRCEKCTDLIGLNQYIKKKFGEYYAEDPIKDIKLNLQPDFHERFERTIFNHCQKNKSKRDEVFKMLSDNLKINEEIIKNWTKGKGNPTTSKLKLLSKALGVSTDYLLGISKIKTKTEDYTNEERKLVQCYRKFTRDDKNNIQGYFLKLSEKYTK